MYRKNGFNPDREAMKAHADVFRREKINPLFWKVIQEHDDWIVVRNWLTKKYRDIKK